jgi:mRNA interferase HicA
MKHVYFLKYLRKNGCELLREGARHSWWVNTSNNHRSSVPRHNEIIDQLAIKICKDLGIKPIK